jgi:hypothetical protein
MIMYEIHSKSDFQAGATLIVRIPEEDIDKKAFYTIQSEQPDFVLPFRHRAIDGQIEFTYQIGNRSKLAYLSGSRSPGEYADLWLGLLQPLLDCGDWFMTPYSFVLKPEYLYCDKNGKSVSFVYIPSVRDCSDYDALKSMVTDVAKQNHVTDVQLENKVVWAIQDFNPNDFLQMVKPYKASALQERTPQPQHEPAPAPKLEAAQPEYPVQKQAAERPIVEKPVTEKPVIERKSDDISISFPPDGKTLKEKKPKGGLFAPKKEKEAKPPQEAKEKGGFWGKKKTQQREIIQGAAVTPRPDPIHEQPVIPIYTPPVDMDDDVTHLEINETDAPKFRYVGGGGHPIVIEVVAAEGEIFSIGRFDVSVGVKQSSFEFDKKTKAVSRRHAVVERSADGYIIVDLDSSAGTFINGQRLPPNVPSKLERGCRVSFGHSGADYIWEE